MSIDRHFERAFQDLKDDPRNRWEKATERDLLIEAMASQRSFYLHIDPKSFRVWKIAREQRQILKMHGFGPNYDPTFTPQEVKESLLEDLEANESGEFTFVSNRLYLAYTAEVVEVPDTELWHFRTFFILEDEDTITPLTTHISAPLIKPGSRGKQTYEILNTTSEDITVNISRLACPVAVIATGVNATFSDSSGNFNIQDGTRPRLGQTTRW